ncbi:MAG: type III PLP-dependent enzyme [Alphaproteobacteria bacterium]|nr:type III PLP-dependent enzyme [Alphaproteobacteria bacterium]
MLQPEEPVFCYSAEQLKAKANAFLKGFPGTVSYAVKSNPAPAVLGTLARAGLQHWDVASVHEMAAVRAHSAKARFHYHNPVKSRREIADAYHVYGCRRFAVDCREELQKIADVVGGDRKIEIAVRFVLPRERTSSAHDFSTKFGAPEHIAAELLRDAKARGFIPLLTFHPGSQSRDPQTYVRHIEAAARIARTAEVNIGKLNVGGGFPADYPHSKGGPLEIFFHTIAEANRRCFGEGEEPALECEPGRGLVATSMSLLTRVKLVCSDGDDLFINDGVYGGLMEFMQVLELQPPYRVIRDGQILDGETKPWKVFGPTCDPLDVLPHRLDLPVNIRDEDYIEFGTLGAYGIATSTMFNGYGGHEVIPVETAFTL